MDDNMISDEQFLSCVIELKQAYLDNDLEQAEKIVNILNTFQTQHKQSYVNMNTVFEIIYFSNAAMDNLIPNDTLFYIVEHLDNIEFQVDLQVKLSIDYILKSYKNDLELLKSKMQQLINKIIEENIFKSLSLNIKISLLKLSIEYQLEEEYMKIQNLFVHKKE